MAQLRRADTPLAEWLAGQMARWMDPETRMAGLSQRRLARETGISQTQLHEVLKKGHSPGPDILKRLARFFSADPLALFRLAYLDEESGIEADPGGSTITQEVRTG